MSFSLEAKIESAAFPMKKPCCRRAFILGVLLFAAERSDDEVTLYNDCAAIAAISAKFIKEQFGRDTSPVKAGKGIELLQFKSKSASEFLTNSTNSLDVSKLIKCEECMASFLRGAFVGGGTVSEPSKTTI